MTPLDQGVRFPDINPKRFYEIGANLLENSNSMPQGTIAKILGDPECSVEIIEGILYKAGDTIPLETSLSNELSPDVLKNILSKENVKHLFTSGNFINSQKIEPSGAFLNQIPGFQDCNLNKIYDSFKQLSPSFVDNMISSKIEVFDNTTKILNKDFDAALSFIRKAASKEQISGLSIETIEKLAKFNGSTNKNLVIAFFNKRKNDFSTEAQQALEQAFNLKSKID
jgi:hypothetical protein